MFKLRAGSLALAAGTALSASSAWAADCATNPNLPGCANAVPEISALEGTAALAAVIAIVLLAWERRRRAA